MAGGSSFPWDSGDCEKSCELRRMVVLGPYYKEVDHVEYQCVGPAGQKQTLSLEEGLQWEGLLEGQKEQRGDTREDEDEDYDDEEQDNNWRNSLSDL
ncbi:hypothetical protein HOP50_19g84480 [Chloropicon primus]|uniref:Uncharacterized protein n=1 Tax=Chloropicon primus TaxID=1764295 RepID=A0A5B8MZI3_9CHLO|nr:hypothetical protein A3770_19p84170 [Chloropicon primus]UPR05100.1 hypothetical protein HOP50_19g84480 [Chloropicon primus]|eukprot:QDZ25899.1 hypothetical protein A3770_19p84170 [Chloropicon primus]